MARTTLELTIMAAEDLKDVATFGKMNLYAVARIDPYVKQSTSVLHKVGEVPVWNETVTLSNLDDVIQTFPNAFLSVQILCESRIGDKVVGTASLPLQEVVRISPGEDGDPVLVELPLQRPSGRTQGVVRLSLRITGDRASFRESAVEPVSYASDKAEEDQDPVIGIPVPSSYDGQDDRHSTTSTGYPSLPAIEGQSDAMVPSTFPPAYQGYPGYQGYYPGYQGYTGIYPAPYPHPYVPAPRPQYRSSNSSLLMGLLWGTVGGLILGDIFQ